jgi:tetrahydromethanopterin S-methyltransferase subunit F
MITEPTTNPKPSSRTKNLVTGILISGWILSVLLILSIVSASVYLQIMHPDTPLPDTLREWSGISIGFLFGNFFTIIKEYVTANNDF